ncbi:DUF6508 domain-containing protein [Virgibacillus necropolis]|uniref:DUF6508 domain-containing protein n=1 Tax=Virgibacillus necropolis TaxID=163877 RepID=UPI0038507CB8
MTNYQKLYSYLPGGEKPFVCEQNLLYTEYAQEMGEFAECFYEAGFVDKAYTDTLEEYGITDFNEIDRKISTADERLIKAILTKMIRDERFTSGAWISYAKKGLFEKVLRRIGELYGIADD